MKGFPSGEGELRGSRVERADPRPAVGRQEVDRRLRLDRADARGRPPEDRGGRGGGRQEARLHDAGLFQGEVVALLSVNNVEVIYDHVILVLKGVSLEVPAGGVVALLGANGAGKSTTLKAISNLLHAERGEITKGSIEFDGERIDGRDAADLVRAGVVQVLEGRRVFEHLTVEENLLAGAYTHAGIRARGDLERVYQYFPRLRERRRSEEHTSELQSQSNLVCRLLLEKKNKIQ